MEITTYNQKGEAAGSVKLPDKIFGITASPALLHQAVIAQMSNMRHVIAHAKDRSEVRGGGRKPWRQKGTGRARHGSRRSPIWIGGGATFGPTNARNFKKKINKKMARKALLMALSSKARDKELIVLDALELQAPKTKEMAMIVDAVIPGTATAALMLPEKNDAVRRAGRNIPAFTTLHVSNINIVDILNHKYLLITKDTITALKKRYTTTHDLTTVSRAGLRRARATKQ